MKEDLEEKYKLNEKLVYHAVKSIKYIPERIEMEEVYQVGRMALWKAINSYNEETSVIAFSNHCIRAIQNSIIDWLRIDQRIKRKDVFINMQSESYTIDEQVEFSMLVNTMKQYVDEVNVGIFIDRNINKMNFSELTGKYKLSKVTLTKRLKETRNILQEKMRSWNL